MTRERRPPLAEQLRRAVGPPADPWAEATRDVQPLADDVPRVAPAPPPPKRSAPPPEDDAPTGPAPSGGPHRRQLARLRAGDLPIEARLDLHGLTEAQAERVVAGFVAESRARGRRVVLVVHGRGLGSAGPPVLKAALARWIEGALAGAVLASAPAQPADGGAGATYLLLRRQ